MRTTTIATIGPSSSKREILAPMIEHGVRIFRLNFSHAPAEEFAPIIELIRELELELGTTLTVLGWFGFNGGSVLSADPVGVSFVFVTTTLAACAGIMGAMATSWTIQEKPDLSMVLNGCLAGLVGITAGADVVSLPAAIIIGFIAGVLVVFAVLGFDRLRLDDPVGALSVHLVCGIWGTLAVGLFSSEFSFMSQLIGVSACGAACLLLASALFMIIRATIGLRVSEEEEMRGLDIGEHGMESYGGFQVFTTE